MMVSFEPTSLPDLHMPEVRLISASAKYANNGHARTQVTFSLRFLLNPSSPFFAPFFTLVKLLLKDLSTIHLPASAQWIPLQKL